MAADAPSWIAAATKDATVARILAAADEFARHFRAGTGDHAIVPVALELARAVDEARAQHGDDPHLKVPA